VNPALLWPGPILLALSDVRDVIVIVWGIISILLLLALTFVIVSLTLSVRRLIREVNDLINTGVKPVLASARESVDNVTWTTRFVGDKAVAPVVRTIGIINGIRRGVSVFTGLTGRRRGRGEH
jgi:hypothetical protein